MSVVRSGLVSLPATSLIQVNLLTAVTAKSTTLRVTDIIRNKHKKHYTELFLVNY